MSDWHVEASGRISARGAKGFLPRSKQRNADNWPAITLPYIAKPP
ncbi:MAG: hypothetical protein P4L76_01830 [Beijerinckiaceae bacterium]|nr:hypothetical protein [Beijerinckiaceae bacterium]